mmetsp:Transcript_26431/g.77669  ORF Transcript_26431/g.77669 Transcript_26431/m.77669 type:complete len:376 (-) Transcript_26431:212-1339(-)
MGVQHLALAKPRGRRGARGLALAPVLLWEEDVEGDDGEALLELPVVRSVGPHKVDVGVLAPAPQRLCALVATDFTCELHGDQLAYLEGYAAADRLEHRRCPAILASLVLLRVVRVMTRHEGHRAAPGLRRHAVLEQRPPRDKDSRRAGAGHELVRRDKHSVEGDVALRLHGYRDVGAGTRVVDEDERARRPGNTRHIRDGRADARHVAARRDGDDAHRPRLVLFELALEEGEVDAPRRAHLRHLDDVRDGLPPRADVGVVLRGAVEHDRARVLWDVAHEAEAVLELARKANAKAVNELVEAARHARAHEERGIDLRVRVEEGLDDRTRLLTKVVCLAARGGQLRVGVGVHGRHFVAHEVLHHGHEPAAGCVVCVS